MARWNELSWLRGMVLTLWRRIRRAQPGPHHSAASGLRVEELLPERRSAQRAALVLLLPGRAHHVLELLGRRVLPEHERRVREDLDSLALFYSGKAAFPIFLV